MVYPKPISLCYVVRVVLHKFQVENMKLNITELYTGSEDIEEDFSNSSLC